ncbi:MAG: hypothetical protein H6667_22080 [Ardenticatenaceae bacterium]|nr:hypothetical protein [Ardenticatenaceae bacterium]
MVRQRINLSAENARVRAERDERKVQIGHLLDGLMGATVSSSFNGVHPAPVQSAYVWQQRAAAGQPLSSHRPEPKIQVDGQPQRHSAILPGHGDGLS